MVCKSGKGLWQKIDELGPKVKCQRIPEQVISDGNIISDINLVLKEWESKFSELYTGVLPGISGFDDDFLNSALKNIGINNEFLNIMTALYKKTECTIKINDKVTDWFQTYAGIRQGQNDSPTQFAIYANSLAEDIKSLGPGIKIGDTLICLLMYADDIVLIAESEKDLQLMLDKLTRWCSKWRMLLNTEKTQTVHIRHKNAQKTTFIFKVAGTNVKIVNRYRYLGVTFNELFGKQEPGNILADGANRALGKLLSKYYLNKGLGIGTYTKLYESCVVPVMDYCSSIWGYNDNDKLDKIHMKTIRCYNGVNRYAPKQV